MANSAQPLNVSPSTPAKPAEADKNKTPTPPTVTKSGPKSGAKSGAKVPSITPADISSPHELTAFVENILEQLETKFDDMSGEILERMNQMSTRVDALEAAIHDIINGDISVPQSPSPNPPTPGIRRSDSGFQ